MHVIIDIPKKEYDKIGLFVDGKTPKDGFNFNTFKIFERIANGKPLPKGHGDLKDADELKNYFWDNRSKLFQSADCMIAIDSANTIILADTDREREDEYEGRD